MAEPVGPVIIDPLAVLTFGLVGTYVASMAGLGLNTFGFLWPADAVWTECQSCADDVVTVWTECEGCD